MPRMNDISEKLEEGVERVRERVEDARERIEDLADNAQVRGREAWKDAKRFVQKHPGETVGVALLIGIALGSMLGGRRRGD